MPRRSVSLGFCSHVHARFLEQGKTKLYILGRGRLLERDYLIEQQ